MTQTNEQRCFKMLGQALAAPLNENRDLAAQLEPLLVERLKGMDLNNLPGIPKKLDEIAREIEVSS